MSLKYAILSMVINKEKSGYDIAKEFKNTINFFWKASHQQIYKCLSELEKNQLVEHQLLQQTDKPDKKSYSITQTGRQELAEWVSQPSKQPVVRNELLVKLLSIETVGAETIIEELKRYLSVVNDQLEVYKKIEEEHYQCDPNMPPSLYYTSLYLTLRKGIIWAKSEMEWINESISLLSEKTVKN